MNATIDDLTQLVIKFRDEREWAQFHNPKDMAISLSLEAAELLEFMQWKSGDNLDQHLNSKRNDVGYELADVLYWTLLIAHHLKIDVVEVFMEKLELNRKKYPVDLFKGSAKKYTELKTKD